MYRLLLAALVVLHVACGLHTALGKTITHDEIWHLPVGIMHWRNGTFDQDVLNPPLTRLWDALPAAIAGVDPDPRGDATDVALEFVLHQPDHRTWYLWGRAFNLAFSVGTLLIVVCWTRDWFGPDAAVLAALLYVGCPNIVAHASLVTPDAGLMFAFAATLYLLVRWLDRRTWSAAILFGLVLGLAQATKFTAILLYPSAIAIWLIWRWPEGATSRGNRWQFPVALAISLIGWNAPFLFEGTGQRLEQYALKSQSMRALQRGTGSLARLPIPLPRDYVAGFDAQRAVMEQPHPIFLDGEWSLTGFRSYFLRTLQYKLPHVLQLFVATGLLTLLATAGAGGWRRMVVLWLPSALLIGIASLSSMQLGVRYILPALPLMIVNAACTARWLNHAGVGAKSVAFVVVAFACGTSLRHHPHHIAYFNELAGGPVGGRYRLLDSNIDWGQDLHLVKEFMQREGLDRIGLVYFGTLPASVYGIDFVIPPGWRPDPGWHAVSVNYVMGRPHTLAEPDNTPRASDLDEFAYFQQFEPVARLGYSIDVYHIPDADRDWTADTR